MKWRWKSYKTQEEGNKAEDGEHIVGHIVVGHFLREKPTNHSILYTMSSQHLVSSKPAVLVPSC